MFCLTWKFEWARKRATAVASHGTYVVEADEFNRWCGEFFRAGRPTESHTDIADCLRSKAFTFDALVDAIKACQHHAQRFTPLSSDRVAP